MSQRSSSIRQADLILVLDDGNLVGQGTHQELLKICAPYREIFFSQFPDERKNYNTTQNVGELSTKRKRVNT